jgi:hypothetical protein
MNTCSVREFFCSVREFFGQWRKASASAARCAAPMTGPAWTSLLERLNQGPGDV